ncbi:MarR family winged helix-turn-helix transcriptional regulator [Pusillimonas noertemannii]|uniref:DNA-binding MarR family transcriptional regulator n=1 Tax=Pusillimonas noertemannii TaxID=305977 RepID=A0A2U1CM33_9BURK|nr:MarR family winged helix-turn-helix transcriptional regulator [Pusillimonas noertemannii]PVY62080.1 DNA-binding MarR family transcriptional regulator [Pusillimonas noertemannii]
MMNDTYPPPSELSADTQAMTDLTLTVFRVHGALLQWGDKLVEPLGLTSARWQMLGAIALTGKALTAPQVAEVMGVTRQGAQKQLNLLLELGLLESCANPSHRRSPLYALTPRGDQIYRKAEALWVSKAAEFAAGMSLAQLQTATTTLGAMLSHLTLPSSPKDLP